MKSIYMDYNARAPLSAKAQTSIVAAFDLGGNPSSPHGAGRRARAVVENARRAVADFVGGQSANVLFTSSGTEANVQALRLADDWLVSAVEHVSVLANCRHQVIPVDENGVVRLADFDSLLDSCDQPFVSVQLANNETGVIQPVRELADRVHACGGFIHCDAVQAAGKMVVRFDELGVDALSLSGHKLGAAPGVGALVFADGVDEGVPPQGVPPQGVPPQGVPPQGVPPQGAAIFAGGGQEFGRRAGTENLLGIASLAGALQDKCDKPLAQWRAKLEAHLPAGAIVFGQGAARLDNTTCFALPNVSAQKALILFDLAGIALSAGAACSSGALPASAVSASAVSVSAVLLALGVSEDLAAKALRVSLGAGTCAEDINYFIETAHSISAQACKEVAA